MTTWTGTSADIRARLRLRATAAGLMRLFRHFPFAGPVLVSLPILAREIGAGRLDGPGRLALIAPLVLALSAGYVYNDLHDLTDPPGKGNPVAAGAVTVPAARLILVAAMAASCLTFAALYRQPLAWLAFSAYLALTLAYSGLGIRLKETLAGPALGAVILWVGFPVVLALELDTLDWSLAALLCVAWMSFTACEVAHTLVDFDDDRRSGYRTFAQRLGYERTWRLQHWLLVVGGIAWIWAACNLLAALGTPWRQAIMVGVGMTVLGIAVVSSSTAWPESLMLPYGALKRGWLALVILLLGLSPVETGLVLWLCLTIKLG